MRAIHAILLALATLSWLSGAQAVAQTDQRVPVDRATTQQKATFVENLVTRSVAAETIETKGDEAAKAKLARARQLVDQAKNEVADGRFEEANEKLDEALRLVNSETRRLSASDMKQQRDRDVYEKRHNSVEIFLSAYKRVAGEKALSAATAGHVAEIETMIGEAERLAESGRIGEANALLERAYLSARGDLREMREGDRLTRSLNFETAEEEYRYERDRNDSHVALLQYAISEKNPTQVRRARIEELRKDSLVSRNRAEEQAARGDYPAAIDALVHSTDTLLKAIRMSGVWIPG